MRETNWGHFGMPRLAVSTFRTLKLHFNEHGRNSEPLIIFRVVALSSGAALNRPRRRRFGFRVKSRVPSRLPYALLTVLPMTNTGSRRTKAALFRREGDNIVGD